MTETLADVALPPHPTRQTGPTLTYGAALLAVAGATLIAVLTDQMAAIPNLALIFVLPVVIIAVAYGWGPALLAAVAGAGAYNFFLIEPRYSFRVGEAANVWSLGLLLAVAAIVSGVAAQARARAVEARSHADQAAALQGLARALMGAADRPTILRLAAETLGRMFQAPAVVGAQEGEALRLEAAPGGALPEADLDAAKWALAAKLSSRAQAYPVENARYDFWPVLSQGVARAVIGLDLTGRDEGRPAAPERLVEIVGGYVSVALERERLAAEVLEGRMRRESERLKADLLAAVSHDLRTPLATIIFTLQSLRRFEGVHDAATKAELLALAETEAERLSALVSGLLDMSRIDAESVMVRAEAAPLADLIAAALLRCQSALNGHRFTVGPVDAGLKVAIDFPLAESALANVLENAGKYSPAGSAINLNTRRDGEAAVIEVLDEGEGFAGPAEAMFAKFARGIEGDGRPPGAGLGLAIARGFIEAQGGSIEAVNRPTGGACLCIRLPLADGGPDV